MPIREAEPPDAKSMAKIHIQTWRTSYAGIVPNEYLSSLSHPARAAWWKQVLEANSPALCNFVAEDAEGGIVGFAHGGPERDGNQAYLGELYAIYVLQPFQRRGFGHSLFSAVTERMILDGFPSMLLWVLQDNRPACRFYEALGGKEVGEKTIEIGGASLVEVAYGWKDITALTAAPGA